ncbi:hypothetical protein [Clostridium saccharobutylicum]|uniref:Autolysin n=1 Tax=Clostridium saccharobutylicum TaxID=169679 RepID=A0A1S8NHT6_CLOSA|nr:hypothetical protein [Clostridium saccharobutylicum]OOM16039.1 autolysin [Clostridium saccharobutylicum]
MKKLNLSKIITGILVVASVLSLNPIGVSAEWKKDNSGWWYSEGSSYATGWKNINETWYYFYSNGYVATGWQRLDGNWYYFHKGSLYSNGGDMQHDTIIDGYYLNSNGVWANETAEMQKYSELLNDINWQKNNGINGTINKNFIVDLDQDGVYEMVLNHGTCEADKTTTVVTYNNGNIKVEHLSSDHGGYWGYSKSERVFFINGGTQGFGYLNGYKLENGYCEKVYSSISDENHYGKEKATYTINGEKVSRAQYKESIERFGEIDKNGVIYG